jgi:competence protein ComEA
MKSVMTALLSAALLSFCLGAAQADDAQADTRVDINRAGVEELVQLPGIGETVAKRIIEYREENGGFAKTEELMNVRGIGEKTYEKIEPMLTVGTPAKK